MISSETRRLACGYNSPQFQSVFWNGYRWAEKGEPRKAPYRDWRNSKGHVTFARGFRAAWLAGYDAAVSDLSDGKQELKP